MYITSIKNRTQWDGDMVEGKAGVNGSRNEPENDENIVPVHGFLKNEVFHKGK